MKHATQIPLVGQLTSQFCGQQYLFSPPEDNQILNDVILYHSKNPMAVWLPEDN